MEDLLKKISPQRFSHRWEQMKLHPHPLYLVYSYLLPLNLQLDTLYPPSLPPQEQNKEKISCVIGQVKGKLKDLNGPHIVFISLLKSPAKSSKSSPSDSPLSSLSSSSLLSSPSSSSAPSGSSSSSGDTSSETSAFLFSKAALLSVVETLQTLSISDGNFSGVITLVAVYEDEANQTLTRLFSAPKTPSNPTNPFSPGSDGSLSNCDYLILCTPTGHYSFKASNDKNDNNPDSTPNGMNSSSGGQPTLNQPIIVTSLLGFLKVYVSLSAIPAHFSAQSNSVFDTFVELYSGLKTFYHARQLSSVSSSNSSPVGEFNQSKQISIDGIDPTNNSNERKEINDNSENVKGTKKEEKMLKSVTLGKVTAESVGHQALANSLHAELFVPVFENQSLENAHETLTHFISSFTQNVSWPVEIEHEIVQSVPSASIPTNNHLVQVLSSASGYFFTDTPQYGTLYGIELNSYNAPVCAYGPGLQESMFNESEAVVDISECINVSKVLLTSALTLVEWQGIQSSSPSSLASLLSSHFAAERNTKEAIKSDLKRIKADNVSANNNSAPPTSSRSWFGSFFYDLMKI